jgi:hypothetical protein
MGALEADSMGGVGVMGIQTEAWSWPGLEVRFRKKRLAQALWEGGAARQLKPATGSKGVGNIPTPFGWVGSQAGLR